MNFLLVDDDPSLLHGLRNALGRSYSASIVLATTTESALAEVEETRFDLVTTDLNRPGKSGAVFVETLQKSPLTRRVPVVVISGNYDDAQELALYRVGARAVLRKPFPLSALFEVVDRLLDMRRSPDEALLDIGCESASLDYKQTLSLETKDARASLAKDIIAFANSGGGTIVVGMAEPSPGDFVPYGLSQEHLAGLEGTRVGRAVRDYITPSLPLTVKRFKVGSRTFVRIDIPGSRTIVLARKQNDVARLYLGRIYVRSDAAESIEARDPEDVHAVLQRIRMQHERERPDV